MMSSPSPGAQRLPVELLEYLLLTLSPSELQSTALALLQAIPSAPLSRALLVRHLRVTRQGQAAQCTNKLRQEPLLRQLVRTAVVECWRDDPQLLINLIGSLPNITSLRMTVGPLFAPEHLDELLERPTFRGSIQQIWMRFNPYVLERSYYSFLKGAYFDTAPLAIAQWPIEAAPHLRRLAYAQDLLPSHGIERKETPAFGLQDLSAELDDLASGSQSSTPPQLPSGTETRLAKRLEAEKADFAQPIVFHRLFCIASLAISPIGSRLTHLVLRLPRRNVLTALTSYPIWPPPRPFASLESIDLSTTHIIADQRVPLFLRLHPGLKYLVLDRCSGLIGNREADQPAAISTLKWLGHTCASIGKTRADEALRLWRKLVRDRSSTPDVTTASTSAPRRRNPPTPTAALQPTPSTHVVIKDLLILPPVPRLQSLGLGLFEVSPQLGSLWQETFFEGYAEALDRTIVKIRDQIVRWEGWNEAGKLRDGTRRMIAQEESIPLHLLDRGGGEREGEWEEDPLFQAFLKAHKMRVVDASIAKLVLADYLSKKDEFVLCLKPDCSAARGVAHLSLASNGAEDRDERARIEKGNWEREKRDRVEWRKGTKEHEDGCAHLDARRAWEEED